MALATANALMDGAGKGAELPYVHEIVSIVKKHHVPPSMILNLDQKPLKFVQTCHRMAQKGSSNVEFVDSGDKSSIAATFVVTLDGRFPSMQLIYDGKQMEVFMKVLFKC